MVALYDLLPSSARLVLSTSSGATRSVPADTVAAGDLIRVLPGDRLPVDGVVVSGRTTVDESALSGEPMPVTKAEGAPVTAGTINLDGAPHALHVSCVPACKLRTRMQGGDGAQHACRGGDGAQRG
jgi:P-type Cu+ transporter